MDPRLSRFQHVNFVMTSLYDLLSRLYEALADEEYDEAVEIICDIQLILREIKSSAKDEIDR
jgi:hypothetical protein